MAELLVRWTDRSHPDPEVDRRGSYKRGYVINSYPDNHTWGRKESKQQWISEGFNEADWHGRTVLLKLPNRSPDELQFLAQSQKVDDEGKEVLDENGEAFVFRRREWQVDLDSFPPPFLQELEQNGELTINASGESVFINATSRIRDGKGPNL